MIELKQIELKPLKKISPSQFTRLKKCPYSSVLSKSFSRPLLPYSPSIHLGTIIHKCIQKIYTNRIRTEEEFEQKWMKFEKEEEKKLKEYDFNFFIPLSENVSGYAIKKLQVKSVLKKQINKIEEKKNSGVQFINEKWLQSADAMIGGSVDHILKADGFVKLIDTKTGDIYNEEGRVKEDYKEQLKLYAYLYSQEYGQYPHELAIRDLKQNEILIPFSMDECEALAETAKIKLKTINRSVIDNDFEKLAHPAKDTCNGCLYRPACKYHWAVQKEDSITSFTDLKGVLISNNQYKNGNINITLEGSESKLIITGLNSDRLGFLNGLKGKEIGVYNLIKTDLAKVYKPTKWTTIYEA